MYPETVMLTRTPELSKSCHLAKNVIQKKQLRFSNLDKKQTVPSLLHKPESKNMNETENLEKTDSI